MNKFDVVKKTIANPAIFYLISRYAVYGIQFINSIFIAVYLGPYYLGVWGFINLVIGYVAQINFGFSNAVNVTVSVEKQNEEYARKIIGNGLSMVTVLSILTLVFFALVTTGWFSVGEKYHFSRYVFPIAIISFLTHINGLLANIFRIYGKINAIMINQSLFPIIVFCLIPFFRSEQLLWAMLLANLAAFIISFIQYITTSPVKLHLLFNGKTVKFLVEKGWMLFLYNASFYLIILSTNTFISSNYRVEEFGYYTFSYSLANVVLLLLNSIGFLIFPKLLNRFATLETGQIQNLLKDVRAAYISLAHLLIHLVILLFPLFLFFFPSYSSAALSFKMVALTVVLYSNSFGYQGVLMAKGKERQLAYAALGALLINALIAAVLVYLIKVPFSMVILATLLTYLLYVFVIGLLGRKILGLDQDFLHTLADIYPWRMMAPFCLSLGFAFFAMSEFFFVLPFVLFLILNHKEIAGMKQLFVRMIKNPKFIDI